MTIPGFLGIPDRPGLIPGCKPQGYPKSKYPRFPGNTRQSRDYPGMQATGLYTPSPSIPGFLGIPDSAGLIPGCKPQGYPKSKYPRILWNTRHRDASHRATPVQVSQDSWEYQTVPGSSRDASHRATPSPSIPGFLGILYRQSQDYLVTVGMTMQEHRQGYCLSKYPKIAIIHYQVLL